MISIELKITNDEIKNSLERLQKALGDPTPAMQEIASAMRAKTQMRFRYGIDPSGKPWKPSRRVQKHGGQTLVNSGILKNSISSDAGHDYAAWGTNVKYAATHQFGAKKGSFGRGIVAHIKEHWRRMGTKKIKVREYERKINIPWGNIPARRFLGMNETDWNKVIQITEKYIEANA